MGTLNIVLGVILIIAALFLIVAVLAQSGNSDGSLGILGGGGSENYLGKSKGKTRDKILSKATTVVAIIFAVIVLLVYIFQSSETKDVNDTTGTTTAGSAQTTVADTDEGLDSDATDYSGLTSEADETDAADSDAE